MNLWKYGVKPARHEWAYWVKVAGERVYAGGLLRRCPEIAVHLTRISYSGMRTVISVPVPRSDLSARVPPT